MSERVHTVIVGGGQSGLAVGYQLKQRGLESFVILDAAERVGDSWRKRWDSLVLFTWADYNNLPGLDFPADKNHLPTKDEAASYLEAYVAHFDLPVEMGVRVDSVNRDDDGLFVVETSSSSSRTYRADNVVVATGAFQEPRIPAFADELSPSITRFHSSVYRSPAQLTDGDVLVVGAATSGTQIASEIARAGGRRVFLSGRSVDALPPGKAKILRALGIVPFVYSRPRDSFIGKRIYKKALTSGHPLIGYTYKDVVRAGVERTGRTAGCKDGKPIIEGDKEPLDVANVVFATGYRPDFSWVQLPVFEDNGYPRHERGVVDEAPGLFFTGLIFLHSLGSQLFMGAARDSDHLATAIMARPQQGQSAGAASTPWTDPQQEPSAISQ